MRHLSAGWLPVQRAAEPGRLPVGRPGPARVALPSRGEWCHANTWLGAAFGLLFHTPKSLPHTQKPVSLKAEWGSERGVVRTQGGMMTSPSGTLGGQFNMGRVPSMGLGNLDSMELPDTVCLLGARSHLPVVCRPAAPWRFCTWPSSRLQTALKLLHLCAERTAHRCRRARWMPMQRRRCCTTCRQQRSAGPAPAPRPRPRQPHSQRAQRSPPQPPPMARPTAARAAPPAARAMPMAPPT
jgi:hypothetical protein